MGAPMQDLLIFLWVLCKLIPEPLQPGSFLRTKFPSRSFIYILLFLERLGESFRAMNVNCTVLRNLKHPGREPGPLGSLKLL